ncbi:hypothetical protein [Thalassotalea aquiviva]|uniref:hypothetical protein n=1 Tax=Thalassotalea aquiviva TaxID=3242415 RepID=UPI00352A1F1A
MDYENTDLKTRAIKHYLLPMAALIYCLFGAFSGELTMFTRSGTVSIPSSDALILSIAPALWLISDLVMFEPKFQLTKAKRLTWGILLLIPAGYIFYKVLFA